MKVNDDQFTNLVRRTSKLAIECTFHRELFVPSYMFYRGTVSLSWSRCPRSSGAEHQPFHVVGGPVDAVLRVGRFTSQALPIIYSKQEYYIILLIAKDSNTE